jgi:hypothetical protein
VNQNEESDTNSAVTKSPGQGDGQTIKNTFDDENTKVKPGKSWIDLLPPKKPVSALWGFSDLF